MAKNLEKQMRKYRVPVLLRFKETMTDGQGRQKEGYNVYPVYMRPNEAAKFRPL